MRELTKMADRLLEDLTGIHARYVSPSVIVPTLAGELSALIVSTIEDLRRTAIIALVDGPATSEPEASIKALGLPDESKAELLSFAHHLRTHRGGAAPDCRFCEERHPSKFAPASDGGSGEVEDIEEYLMHNWRCPSTHDTGLPCDCKYPAYRAALTAAALREAARITAPDRGAVEAAIGEMAYQIAEGEYEDIERAKHALLALYVPPSAPPTGTGGVADVLELQLLASRPSAPPPVSAEDVAAIQQHVQGAWYIIHPVGFWERILAALGHGEGV